MNADSVTENVAKHTPGPWRLDHNTSPAAGRAIEARAFDGSLRYVVERVRGSSPEQADANARLIAAAPELLKALKDLHQNVDRDLSGYWTESTSNFMQQAEAAIAKAEEGAR